MWMDMMPNAEKKKLRKRMRSPEKYAQLRESVSGPEKAAEQMERNKRIADFAFALEMEPVVQEALKKSVQEVFQGQGPIGLFANQDLSEAYLAAVEEGDFEVGVDTDTDQITLYPEGNISEKIPLVKSVSDTYVQQFSANLS